MVDGDDAVEKEGFLALIGLLAETRADIVASNYKRVAVNDPSATENKLFEGVEYGRLYEFKDLPNSGNLYLPMHTMTIRTEILQKNHIRLQEHTFYVDSEFVLLPIPFVQTFVFMPEYVYLYNIGIAGQSVDFNVFVKRYGDMYRVLKRLVRYAAECGAEKPQMDYLYSGLMKLCFTNYLLGAFYDDDIGRGRARAREFDAWLKDASPRLYRELGKSLYIRLVRLTHFTVLPRGKKLKAGVKRIYGFFKPLFRKHHRLTY